MKEKRSNTESSRGGGGRESLALVYLPDELKMTRSYYTSPPGGRESNYTLQLRFRRICRPKITRPMG